MIDEENPHSVLNHLYGYKFMENSVGYLLHEPKTNQVILFDAGEYGSGVKALAHFNYLNSSKLDPNFIFCTHPHPYSSEDNYKWRAAYPNWEIISGNKETKLPILDLTLELDNLDKVTIGKKYLG